MGAAIRGHFVSNGYPLHTPSHARVPAEPQSGPTNSFGRCKCWVLILADRGWPGVRGVKGIPIWQKMTAAEPPTRHLSAHGFSAPYISSSICSLMTSEPLAKLSGAEWFKNDLYILALFLDMWWHELKLLYRILT